ncbi:MAG: RluA family pseudouridine synthase [Bacilli bacterium]|nr:RluA family pseudouridine synthase [Bacilli bacterium]
MEIIVKCEDTLLNYLYSHLDMSKKKVKEYLKYGSIYVDGVKTTQFDYPLHVYSKILIDTKSKNTSFLPFPILYEDKNIIVIDKPSNILTVATSKEKEKTVYHMVREYLQSHNKNAKVFIVHRLDKDTSGVLLFAKSEYIKNIYQADWNSISKRNYVCVVHGIVKNDSEKLVHNLKENKTGLVYVSHDGASAITNYQVINRSNHYSLLNITIETGKKNQIRVQLKQINHPIVGDKKYGIKDSCKRLYLHANKLTICNPIDKKIYTYESKIPQEFRKIIYNDR